jgi:hypothetical protein
VTEEDFEDSDGWEYVSEDEMQMNVTCTKIFGASAATTSDVNEYYGNLLTGIESDIYQALDGVTAEENGFSVTYRQSGIPTTATVDYYYTCATTAMYAYMFDHPEKMYFNSTNGIRYGYSYSFGYITVIGEYMVSDYYTAELEAKAESVVDSVIAGMPEDGTRYEQLKYLHNWLVLNSSYDTPALYVSEESERFYYAHGPLGNLLSGTGVCESYAKAFKIFCNRLNIPCVCVMSDTHMWNYVQMEDGSWYMVDCTWDDPVGDIPEGYLSYDYFLVSNDQEATDKDHTEDTSLPYPATSSDAYSGVEDDDTKTYHVGEAAVSENGEDATCTEDGSYESVIYCSVCEGELLRMKVAVAATGHSKVIDDAAVAATCTTAGKTEGSHCKVCGEILGTQEVIPATGHTKVSDATVAATCTTAGKTEGSHCKVCGEVLEKQKEIPATGHTDKTTVTAATTKKNGKTVVACTVCGTVESSTAISYPKTIALKKTSLVYTGSALKPAVTVKDSSGKTISSSNYKLTYKNNKKVGTATVTVTFKGNYSGTKTLSFNIVPKATSLTLAAKSKSIKVSWKKQTSQTTGYQIQYSTSSKFTGAKTVTVKSNKTTSTTIKSLKAKKTYYVRIRTYKKVGSKTVYSAWSGTKKVKTKK